MTIIRVAKSKDNPYVQIDKRPLSDTRLTWKAKGILAYLLSKPNDWQIWVTDLMKRSKDGEHAVRTGLQELVDCGYAIRNQEHDEKGRFGTVEWVVREQPLGGFPQADYPQAEKPDADNHPLTNNDSTKTKGSREKEYNNTDTILSSYRPGPEKLVVCEDPDTGKTVGEPDWHEPTTQMQRQVLLVCRGEHGRFHSKAERNKLERIEAMLESGKLPEEFWKNRLWSAEQYSWSLPKLLKYTLSEDSLRDWEAKQ